MDLDTETAAPDAGSSRRETIEAAFEAAEAPVEVVTPEPVAAPSETAPEKTEAPRTAAEKARDEAGRFAKAAKAGRTVKPVAKALATPVSKTPAAATTTAAPPASTPAPGDQPKPEAAALRPPASWKPAARERWATLPAEVQQETVRRERETQQALQESSEARKNWGSFQQAVAPYAHMIQADGGNPIAVTANLLQTAAALRTGSAPDKAQLVARLVKNFGVDIRMLDDALAGQGQAPQQGQQQSQTQQQFRDPRFDELMARINNGEQQRQQSMAQKSAKEVDDFGSNAEFFDDVRQEMADLLEVAARRGVAMSLEDAYSRAVKLHPEVSEVMTQREKAKAATATQATTQRARAASSSVKSRPAGPAPAVAPNGRRGALEAAWDSHNR